MANPISGKRGTISSFRDLVSTLCDFLTVTFHTILYERDIYPHTLFIKARKYGFPVQQSRHPRVCRWIQDAVEACGREILKGTVSRVSLIVISPKSAPLERYVFDFSLFPTVPSEENYDDPILQQDGEGGGREEILVANLEAQFRACLLKLSVCTPGLGKLPDDCTYTVAVELKDAGAPANYAEIWIPAERQRVKDVGARPNGAKTTAVRTVESGSISLELTIEETNTKTKMASGR